MIAVILVLGLLMALAAGLTTSVIMDTGLRGGFNRATTGFYAAESGLDYGMGSFHNIFLNFRVPTGSDFSQHSFTLGNRTVNYQLTDVGGNPQILTIPPGQVFGGLQSSQYTYIARSQALANGETEADVSAQFDVSYIPLFQFAAFYTGDLEIEPGADMHLHGRVHTNGDLYLNSDAHLWIEDNQGIAVPAAQKITTVQVTAKGDVYRGRKDTAVCNGTVTVDMLDDQVAPSPDLDPIDMACVGGSTTKISTTTLANWKGSIVSNVQNIAVPSPDNIVKGSGAFWQNADLRIVLVLGTPNKIEVQNSGGTTDVVKTALLQTFMTDSLYNTGAGKGSMPGVRPIYYTDIPSVPACNCLTSPAACLNATSNCYSPTFATNARVYGSVVGTLLTDLDYRRGGFYNQREQQWMYLLNVNIHDLLDWNQRQTLANRLFDPADTTDGGLVIYLSVQGPNSNAQNNYGARVFGSANLYFPAVPAGGDPTGITVVSDQAIYVAGDFNLGTAAGFIKQPAAIIGDSLNLMSNNYFSNVAGACANDCQSNKLLSDATRAATSTAINAAFLAGVDNTVPGNYNGGLENYPRFHESWSGDMLTYRGSFVSLGTPRHVDGAWCGTGSPCNIYDPPDRNFDYDVDFGDIKNLPPMTPRFVYVQQLLVTQNFQ